MDAQAAATGDRGRTAMSWASRRARDDFFSEQRGGDDTRRAAAGATAPNIIPPRPASLEPRLDRRALLAWFALPVGLVAWPLLAQDQDKPEKGEKSIAEDEATTPEFAGLVNEIAKDEVRPTGIFETPHRLQTWPTLVARPAGGAWLVSTAWEPGTGDRIVVRVLAPDGNLHRPPGVASPAPLEVEGPGSKTGTREVVRPTALADGEGRLVVTWTETTDAGPVVRAARLEGEAFTPPATLTEPVRSARNVELALHDGRVWCVFESWTPPAAGSDKGSLDVVLAPFEGEKLGKELLVGDGPFTDLDPVAASSGGRLWVAWSRYGGRDYEVMLRSFDPKSGALDAPLDVSAEAASDDLHPSLAAHPDGDLWLAWDRIVDPGRGSSVSTSFVDRYATEPCGVFVMSACVRGGKVLLPEGRRGLPAGVVVGAPQFSWTGGVPRIAIGGDGEMWLAYRYLRFGMSGDCYGYGTVAQRWNGGGWSAPLSFARSPGMPEEPALLATKEGALVAWQGDHRLDTGKGMIPLGLHAKMRQYVDQTQLGASNWFGESAVASVLVPKERATGGAAPDAKRVERPDRSTPPHFHPAADPLADPYVTGARHFDVQSGATTFHAYWGDLHRHSCVSRCTRGMEERPLQRWELGRDAHAYDFMALTDHSGQLDAFDAWLQDKLIRQQRTPDFLALAGFEWSTTAYGHQNVILPGRLGPIVEPTCDPTALYEKITPADAIAIPHGSADQGRAADFSRWDDVHTCLVEVYQAMRGSYEFEGCFKQSKRARVQDCFVQDALAAGRKFGLIASTDHGNGCAYAVVLAQRLDVASLFEAFRARRTYAATTKGMLIDFRIDGRLMGEEVACAAPPKLSVKVRGAAELAELVIFRDRALFASLGRGGARKGATQDLSLTLDLGQKPREGETWQLTLAAPGCELQRDGGVVALHRRKPKPPYARWRLDKDGGAAATFIWPGSFTPDEVDHVYRLDVSGPPGSKLTVAWSGQSRTVTFDELLAGPIRGEAPRGAFELSAREPPDAQVDLSKGLGVRELEQAWTDETAAPGAHWYYARAIQVDGEIVWSSPIFVERR